MNFNEMYRSHLRTAAYRGRQCKKLIARLRDYVSTGPATSEKVKKSIAKQEREIRREAKEAASHALCSRPDLRMGE